MIDRTALSYRDAGVDMHRAEAGLQGLLRHIRGTFTHRPDLGRVELPIGFFANVLRLGENVGLAFSTDGVGTKTIVAQMVDRYDTIGIDCIAMNVNDILCVGAEPLSLVDYLAVAEADPAFLEEIGRGLAAGAAQARISISGGEIAQLPEIIASERPGRGFDLVGTAVGIVPLDRLIVGQAIAPGDVIVGLASNGIHSNGLSLARKTLFGTAGLTVATRPPELDQNLGEELLRPTRIYAREVGAMLAAGLAIRGLAHITSDGFLNLCRFSSAEVAYRIEWLPETPPIFSLIQRLGGIATAEMYSTFNMGIGFCVVVAPHDADRALQIAAEEGTDAWIIGRCVAPDASLAPRAVVVVPAGLVGSGHDFHAFG